MMRRLLVGVGKPKQRGFAPGAAEKLQSRRQRVVPRVAHRHGNRGEAGARREHLVVVASRRIQIANQPRRIAPRRVDQGIELPLVQQLQHARAQLLAEIFAAPAARRLARHVGGRLRALEALLDRRMKSPGLDDVVERVQRRLVAEAGEIVVQIVFELITAAALRPPHRVEVFDGHRIGDVGAEVPELADGPAKDAVDFGVERGRVIRLMQDTDPRALQAVGTQRGRVVRIDVSAAPGRDGIVRIFTSNHLQHRSRISDRAGDSAGDISGEAEGHHTGAAYQAHRRTQSHERLVRGRTADRIAGIAREAHGGEIGGRRRRRSSTRSRRDPPRIVWVARISRQDRVHRLDGAERELRHVRLGDHHSARVAQALDDERILAGRHPLERQRSRGRRHVDRFVVVLDEHRDAVHRPDRPCLPEASIEIVRDCQRIRIDEHDGIQRRTGLVVCIDPRDVLLDKRAARQQSSAERGLDVGDGGLFEAEARGWLCGQSRREKYGGDGDHDTHCRIV